MPRKAVSPKAVELERTRVPFVLVAVVLLGIGVTFGAITWGRSDAGQIDVSATIANSQYVSDASTDTTMKPLGVSNQDFIDMPNGGLVASDSKELPPPPPEEVQASSTATTTEEVSEEDSTTENNGDSSDSVTPESTPLETQPSVTE